MPRLTAGLFAVAALALLLVACRGGARTPRDVKIPVLTPTSAPQRCLNDGYPAEAPQFDGDQFAYATLQSGLQVIDISPGPGPTPLPNDVVTVRFTGFLPDGCIFTTSYVQEDPVAIDLESSIAGVQEGISTMQVGGQRRLRIPPNLGYGPQGFPGRVPPNSAVIFVFDLREIVEESATSTQQAPPGTGTPQPTAEGGSPTPAP
ncbi:MAG: FKBP-type peptidyl-prolyl cis-trans isomerase [Chloroflexi bacterium]|nr:FKBP-type peptidyl-prolyl cis-trans isomerase [Chloroflexota bacterium]